MHKTTFLASSDISLYGHENVDGFYQLSDAKST
jgi:hypothetical protein